MKFVCLDGIAAVTTPLHSVDDFLEAFMIDSHQSRNVSLSAKNEFFPLYDHFGICLICALFIPIVVTV